MRPALSESLSGVPVTFSVRTWDVALDDISRAFTCGSATISATLFTGAAGTPASFSAATTCDFGRVVVQLWMIAATRSRRSRRAGTVANSGSVTSSGRLMILQKRRHTASLVPAAMATWPSVVGYTPELEPPN